MNYYPFHIGDYLSATRHLSWEEDTAYRRLLDVYYMAEKALPSDAGQVSRLVLATTDVQRLAVQAVLDEFFELTSEGWINRRADAEIEGMRDKQSTREQRGAHEKDRMRRHRERRSKLFDGLRLLDIVPPWDISMTELQRLHDENCNGPATDLQRTGNTYEGVACNAPATAVPTPIPTPTPIPNKEKRADAPVLPEWVPSEPWAGFVEMRRKVSKPMTDRAMRLKWAELEKFRDAGHDLTAILDKSTSNNWTDLYEPKTPATGKKQNRYPQWALDAGFANVEEAHNERCFSHNASDFRDGKKIAVAA